MDRDSGDDVRYDGKTLVDSMSDVGEVDEDVEARLERGTAIERYVVLYELGAGGMGVVYAAYDPELDRKVALKLLHAHSRSERARVRLLREAKSIARLTHPHVVTVHDVGTFEGRVFVAMEYVEGLTFRRWVREAQRPVAEVLEVAIRAGRGLVAAHAADLVHRDFKPDNVLVERNGRAVVLDFGLARRASSQEVDPPSDARPRVGTGAGTAKPSDDKEHLTRTGAKLGTPAYMAPEQHLGTTTDSRTDQFSYCVVLWEALYGDRPFRGDTPRDTALAVLRGDTPEAPESDVPAHVRRVLLRGLSTNPEQRYPSMLALLADLEQAPRSRRHLWLAGSLVTVAAASVAGVALTAGAQAEGRCEAATQRWGESWNPALEEKTHAAFVGSQAKFAAAAWTGVDATLERYGRDWMAAYEDACEATHVHHEQSEDTLELRMGCLRDRQRAVSALVHEFGNADAAVVQNAVEAVNTLPRVGDCNDTLQLKASLATLQSPAEPTLDSNYTEPLRDALVDARAKESSARYAQAEAIVRRVIADAEALGADALLAEAHQRAGSILEHRSEFERAEQSFLQAIWAAQRAGHTQVEAEAWVRLVWVSGVERFSPERGHLWAEFARVALRRAGGGVLLVEARLRHNVGGVLYTEKRYDEALHQYRLALAQQTELLGEDDPLVATTLNHIGNALMESKRYAESESSCARSLAMRRRLFGEHHPKVAASLNNLGELERKRNHGASALDYATRSLEIVGGTGGREEDVAIMISGWALRELGRYDEAEKRFARALAMRSAADGATAMRVIDVEMELAKTAAAAGDVNDARKMLARVVALEGTRRPEVVGLARAVERSLPADPPAPDPSEAPVGGLP